MTKRRCCHCFLQTANNVDAFEDRSSGHSRAKAVRRALGYMETHTEDNVPISRICEAAGVSTRTLTRAFQEAFEIGPKAYYQRLRLGHLRRVLLQREDDTQVAQAAHQFGFWHMGQLARDYQALFGELPSQTRRVIHA